MLKKSYHGTKNVNTDKFGHIGGLYSFFTTVRKLIKENHINKVVLCWDGENGGVFRHMIDSEYKSNRKSKKWHEKIEMSDAQVRQEEDKDESILKQRKRIQAYAEELFIRQIEIDDIEADDLISYYCLNKHKKEEIFLYSNDRDFSQLLYLDITIIFPNLDFPITKNSFSLEFGYHYSNALPMKIICGDAADNIKGVVGIKEKTLLKYFPELRTREHTVREICIMSKKINDERVKNKKKPLLGLKNITESVDRLKMNYELINLKKPMLNQEAIDELEQLDMPLSPEGRGSKNLYRMMIEDEFLTIYSGSFVNYVEPFYSVIMHEKQLLDQYNKNVL